MRLQLAHIATRRASLHFVLLVRSADIEADLAPTRHASFASLRTIARCLEQRSRRGDCVREDSFASKDPHFRAHAQLGQLAQGQGHRLFLHAQLVRYDALFT